MPGENPPADSRLSLLRFVHNALLRRELGVTFGMIEIEAIQIHDLGPGGDEISDEFLLRIV